MGRKLMERSIHISTWGAPLFEIISKRSPGINVEEFKKIYVPELNEYIASGKLDRISDENIKTIDKLIDLGKDVFLLSSRSHVEIKHMLDHEHELTKRVKHIYYKSNTKFHKPDPRVFDELLNDNQFYPSQCVYVGDLPSDAKAANGAGLKFIACLESGIKNINDFSSNNVNAVINKFSDLVSKIERLDKIK